MKRKKVTMHKSKNWKIINHDIFLCFSCNNIPLIYANDHNKNNTYKNISSNAGDKCCVTANSIIFFAKFYILRFVEILKMIILTKRIIMKYFIYIKIQNDNNMEIFLIHIYYLNLFL